MVLGLALPADAQRRPDEMYITVMNLHVDSASIDKTLSRKASDELRKRLQNQVNRRDVIVVRTDQVASSLESSGFPPYDPLPMYDERDLARILKSEYYVSGTVSEVAPKQFQAEVRLLIVRGDAREAPSAQPLPIQTTDRLDRTMDAVAREIREAMKQIPGEKQCIGQLRTNQLTEAVASARSAVTAFPQATLARICLANTFYEQYRQAPSSSDSLGLADSVIAVASEILHYDSLNVPALKFSTELYKLRGDSAKSRAAALRLVEADPGNTVLMEQVINELAGSGHANEAVPLVKRLVERNPGDPDPLRTAFLVFLRANAWKDVVETGQQLARVDTAPPDSLYYIRMAVAYDSLNDPQKASEQLAQATAKYPANADLWLAYSKYLTQAGQLAQAEQALKKAAELDSRALIQLLGFYQKQEQSDSIHVVLEHIVASPNISQEDRELAAQVAIGQAGRFLPRPNQPVIDSLALRGIAFASLSNKLSENERAQYIVAATSVQVAAHRLTLSAQAKDCAGAQGAKSLLDTAGQILPRLAAMSGNFANMAKNVVPFHNDLVKNQAVQVKQFCN